MASESLFRQCDSCRKSISVSETICPHCGKKAKKLGKVTLVSLFIFGLVVISLAVSQDSSLKQNNATSLSSTYVKPASLSHYESVKEKLDLQYSWTKSGFGSIMEADFIVTNRSKFDIKDLEIRCEHYAGSGTKIDSNSRIIYEIVKSGDTARYPSFNMGFIADQVSESSCKIQKFSFV